MRLRALILSLGSCLWLALGSIPAAAFAQTGDGSDSDVDSARNHFKAGVDYYRDGDLNAALIEFKRAYGSAPNYRILYNLGQVSRELRDYTESERYFQRYLDEGGAEIEPARKIEIENELAKLKARIGAVVLSANVPNAEFFVDDVSVGKGQLSAPVRVSAGTRRISAAAPGRARVTKVVEAAGGETLHVNLDLPLLATPTANAPTKAPVEKPGVSPALVFGIGTGVLAVGTGVMGYLAYSAQQDYKDELRTQTTSSKLDDLRSDAKTKALVTDILLGASVLSGVATVVFALRGGEDKAPESKSGTHLSMGPGSLQLTSKF